MHHKSELSESGVIHFHIQEDYWKGIYQLITEKQNTGSKSQFDHREHSKIFHSKYIQSIVCSLYNNPEIKMATFKVRSDSQLRSVASVQWSSFITNMDIPNSHL